MLKRHRSSVELLPHDVVELILARLVVKPLLRFKSVSKTWKSTIESRRFQEKQLTHRKQSRGPDVLFVSVCSGDEETKGILVGSIVIYTVRNSAFCGTCHGSCDGLICMFNTEEPSFLINPATGWYRSFPQSTFQHLLTERYKKKQYSIPSPKLGFGKSKGTYKPVWLYNSFEFDLDNVTTCEVFDFSTNAWRYVHPASPYRIISFHTPVHLDGSLYWFTECEETKILSFNLHTETFQVVCKTPFAHVLNPRDVSMSILNDCLGVCEMNWPNQVIWSFDDNNKTWGKLCSIDLTIAMAGLKFPLGKPEALWPIEIFEKTKILLHGRVPFQPLVIYDLHTKSYDLSFKPGIGNFIYYFQSLFSVLPN